MNPYHILYISYHIDSYLGIFGTGSPAHVRHMFFLAGIVPVAPADGYRSSSLATIQYFMMDQSLGD